MSKNFGETSESATPAAITWLSSATPWQITWRRTNFQSQKILSDTKNLIRIISNLLVEDIGVEPMTLSLQS